MASQRQTSGVARDNKFFGGSVAACGGRPPYFINLNLIIKYSIIFKLLFYLNKKIIIYD
jgi:hypothetical protein